MITLVAFFRLASILQYAPAAITLRFLYENESPRTLFKEISRSKDSHIVLDVDAHLVPSLLQAAHDSGVLTEYHNYLITSLVSDGLLNEIITFHLISGIITSLTVIFITSCAYSVGMCIAIANVLVLQSFRIFIH